MKRVKFFTLVFTALIAFSACSKDSSPIAPEPETPEPEPELPVKKEGVFVISTAAFSGAAEVLHTSNTLDSGILNTVSSGVEQSGSRSYTVNNGVLFSLMFGGSAAGAVTAYNANSEKQLEKVTDFQSETMHVRSNVGDDVLMMKQAWQPAEEFSKWYRVSSNSLQIEAQGEFNSKELAGIDKNEKAFFTSFAKVGDKVFAPYWSITSGQTFSSNYLDSNWIAVYNYPDMTLEKVIRDGRTGSIGSYFASGLEIDENEDAYVFGTKLQFRTTSDNASNTPAGIMKIKKGTTEYDPTYFINISSAAGEGQYIFRKMYLGKGYFLLTMGSDRKLYNPYGTTLAFFYKSTIRYAIVNVYDGTFKWVTGTPAPETIGYTSADYSENYSPLDGTGYIAISSGSSMFAASSVVYKFDAETATATPGLKVESGFITAINWLPVKE